jgi:hypothetical protein
MAEGIKFYPLIRHDFLCIDIQWRDDLCGEDRANFVFDNPGWIGFAVAETRSNRRDVDNIAPIS